MTSMHTDDTPQGPLAGLRVIELADEKSAWCGKLMADAGAEVILVEPPGGTAARLYEPFYEDRVNPNGSLYFWHYNTSKRSVTLDVTTAAGADFLRRLIADADFLVESEQPGRLAALGLDYPDLRQVNSDLIMVSITPFGRTGPRSEQEVTDLTLLAGSGPVWSCGYDAHSIPPVRGGGNQGYQTGGHFGFMSALAALLYRDVSGVGQHIDVNMHAASNVSTESATYEYLLTGRTVQRQTGRHASSAPNPTMQTQIPSADGRHITTGLPVRRPEQFRALYEWLQDENLVDEFPESAVIEMGANHAPFDPSRMADDPEFQMLLGAARAATAFIASRMSAADYFVAGQTRGFQVGAVLSPEEVMEDAHFIDRGFVVEVEHPELGRRFRYPGAPYKMHGSPWRIYRRAPLLGEDTDAVLAAAGLDGPTIARLRADGVI